jgi:hypothetical protein
MGGEVFSGGPGCPAPLPRMRVEESMHGKAPRGHLNEAPLQIVRVCFRMDVGMAGQGNLLHPVKRAGLCVKPAAGDKVHQFIALWITQEKTVAVGKE